MNIIWEPVPVPADSVSLLGWWVVIQREHSATLQVGPYPDEKTATAALQDALLIDGFCEEDCLDAWVEHAWTIPEAEVVIIDPTDPMHHGQETT